MSESLEAKTGHNILYVHVLKTKETELCDKLAQVLSYNSAKNLSYKWYQEYMEMVVNLDTAELVMYKRRVVGYWEANQSALEELA